MKCSISFMNEYEIYLSMYEWKLRNCDKWSEILGLWVRFMLWDDTFENFNCWGNRQNANKLGKAPSVSPVNKLTSNKENKNVNNKKCNKIS